MVDHERGARIATVSYSSRDLTRATLSVGAIGALIVSTAWIVRPFVSAFLWATMIVISTWPVLLGLQARLRGKRGMAVFIMTVVLLLVLLVPLGFAVGALVGNSDRIAAWVSSLDEVVAATPACVAVRHSAGGRQDHSRVDTPRCPRSGRLRCPGGALRPPLHPMAHQLRSVEPVQ